ncbi:hypothetical protein [Thalassolituus sp.]|uniref:TA system antitoxin ParD family protein n=1 Tax=Thalassolituus sp. TaxID=2030822 RepID=UPI002638FF59|nr:hypothetical protein [uncultured Thalassolituus sp.]TNC90519.1 MAG: hypothetical protein CSH36_11775 [Thalassolituus sp.]
MPKAHSPVRLDAQLMESARLAGDVLKRSAAEQVEFWAHIGRLIAPRLSPKELLELQAGLLTIRFEEVQPAEINSDSLFDELDTRRATGSLSQSIAAGKIRYQASRTHPGHLEQVQPDGTIITGKFSGGEFKAIT